MRIAALNIRNCFGKRSEVVVNYLRALDATVLVLSEVKWSAQADRCLAGLAGFHVAVSNRDGEYAVAIASKHQLQIKHAGPRLLEAELLDTGTTVLAAYAPAPDNSTQLRQLRREQREGFWHELTCRADALVATPAVIAGDLNACLSTDSHNRTAYSPEWIRDLGARGWTDAWLEFRDRTRPEPYTFFSRKGGFRLDYLFLSPLLASQIERALVRHDQSPRETCNLDHACVMLDMELRSPAGPNSAWSSPA